MADRYKSELHLQSIIYTAFYNKYPEFRIKNSSKKKVKQPRCLLNHNLLNGRSAISVGNATGITKGYPDMSLNIARGNYHGLRMELKIGDEIPTDDQFDVMEALEDQGYYVCWVNNEDDAARIIDYYLNLKYDEEED
jgi:hypothetical protein